MTIKQTGFTLIELMVVVVMIAIIAAIAVPSYQQQIRKAAEAEVTQELLKIAELLAKHKAKNFTYKCFDLASYYGGAVNSSTLTLPRGATGNDIRYTIRLTQANAENQVLVSQACTDSITTPNLGSATTWSMVVTKNPNNTLVASQSYNFLLNSHATRCKNKANNVITTTACGLGAESW